MFVRSETTEAYRSMFRTIRHYAQFFFDIDVRVKFASLDHSEAIASAFLLEWPRVTLLTCWPHRVRQSKRKASLLSSVEVYDNMIKPHLNLRARTHAQFIAMSVIITTHWIETGERDYTNWFRSVYLVKRWDHWHINGAGVAGVAGIIPSQQGIESHHAAIKRTCVPSSRASTSGVLSGILPRILKYDSISLCPPRCALFCEAPLQPEMLLEAGRLIRTNDNYWKVHIGKDKHRRVHSIFFNSKSQIVEPTNATASPVTKSRVTRFAASLGGTVADGISAAEIKFELLSLRRVTIRKDFPRQPFDLVPTWSNADITRIRSFLKCTCQSFVRSGWVCSHALATLALLRLLDVAAALTVVPARHTPGRPASRQPALQTGDRPNRYFSVESLVKKFLQRPGLPLYWKIVDYVEVTDSDTTETSSFVGRVDGVCLSDADGVWVWSVRFEEGAGQHLLQDYVVEDLARAVNRAHLLGVQVQP